MDIYHVPPDPRAEPLNYRMTGFRAKSFSEGTKLPLVVGISQNHK
jgi:hypothetical protein